MKTTATQIAHFLQRPLRGADKEVLYPTSLEDLSPDTLVFVRSFREEYVACLNDTSCLSIVPSAYEGVLTGSYILSPDPRLDFLRAVRAFFYEEESPLSEGATDAFIDPRACIGEGTRIGIGCYIGPHVTIGANCLIAPCSVLWGQVTIGDECRLASHVTIGNEGFGYQRNEEGIPEHFPHLGYVCIGDGVSIGSHTTIDRGTLGGTFIHAHTQLASHIHIAHNCSVGARTLIASGAILSGGVCVGEDSYIAPRVVVREKVIIGAKAFLGMGAVVLHDVPSEQTIVGNPGKEYTR